MEQIKKFLHGKGFALLLTASLLAAAAAGVWAVRALRAELQKSLDGLDAPGTTQQTTPETEPDWDAQEDTTWQQPVTDVANSKADVPQQTPSGASSGAQSGSGSLHEPSALQGASSPASSLCTGSFSGFRRILACQQFGTACRRALYAGARAQRLQRR